MFRRAFVGVAVTAIAWSLEAPAFAAVVTLTGVQEFPAPGGVNRVRGDIANFIDSNLATESYATIAATEYPLHRKQRIAVAFNPADVNRLRVSKYGDVIWDNLLPAYAVDLAIYATTDSASTSLSNRAWTKVNLLTSGYNNGTTTVEQIDATAVQRNGNVFEDVDNKGGPEHPGYPEFYSLTFDPVANATGLMIEFNPSASRTMTYPWNHYRAREIEAHFNSDAVLTTAVLLEQAVNIDMQNTGNTSSLLYAGDSPIEAAPTWNYVAVDSVSNLTDSDGQPTTIGLSLSGHQGRWSSGWSANDLLQDYTHRDSAAWADALITGLDDGKQYNIYVYTGVEGGRYRVGDLIQDAIYAGTGTGGDPDYNPGPSLMEHFVDGKNYVLFEDIVPSSGEILLQYQGITGVGGGIANIAGLTIAEVMPIPEPSTLLLLGLGALGLAVRRRSRPRRHG